MSVNLENLYSNIAFKMVGGQVAVAWAIDDKAKREPYRDGSEEEAGYPLLPNIDSPKTTALALQQFQFAPLPSILGATEECLDANEGMRGSFAPVSDVNDIGALLDAFGLNPTRAKKRDAEEALRIWQSDAETFALVPVKDLMAASRDLKAIVSTLLFSMEDGNAKHHYCNTDMLRKNTLRGFGFQSPDADGYPCYASFLESIRNANEDAFMDWSCFAPEASPSILEAIARPISPETKEQLGEFAVHSINAFLSVLHPAISGRKIVMDGNGVDFCDAYNFWAHKALAGKAGVCVRCGKLFVREKNTGKYCGRSCATMNNR